MGLDFIPTGIATGVSGSIFAKEVTTAIAAAGNFIPAAGVYFAYAVGANCQLQVQDSTGTWQNVTAVAVGVFFGTDGTNVRFLNGGGGSQNVTLIKVG